MGHYEYHLVSSEAKRLESVDFAALECYNTEEKKRDNKDLLTCLETFLNHPEISKLISEDKWYDVFHIWGYDYYNGCKYGNGPGWVVYILADFLYLSGIDFASHMTEPIGNRFDSKGFIWVD